MVGKTFKTVLCLLALALACGTAFAQSARQPQIAHTTHSGAITPAREVPAGLTVIFSNLGPTASDNYNDTTGYYVLGPTNSLGLSEQWIALPFSPAANSHVAELEVAVGWISGTHDVIVGLYSDSSGDVGTLLASGTATKIPSFGACCKLVTVHIPRTAVTAGTQYWIGVTSDDTNAPDFTGVFEASNAGTIAGDVGLGGWVAFSANLPAAAALGTVP